MDDIIELDRRISRAIDRDKGMCFSEEELDLLVSVGAIQVIKSAAAEALLERAQRRQQERQEYRQRLAKPSSPQPSAQDVQIALERAQEWLRPKTRVPRSKLTSGQKQK